VEAENVRVYGLAAHSRLRAWLSHRQLLM